MNRNNQEKAGSYLTAKWSNIAVANFVVDPILLRPYLPENLELASYKDQYLISLVGFQFQDTRMQRLPVPFYGKFIELYLGFFAQRNFEKELRRGWVFVRKIVPSAVVATVGRLLYNEDYINRSMREQIEAAQNGSGPYKVRYEWMNNQQWNHLELVAGSNVGYAPAPGSIEEYITENYGGYARRRGGGSIEFPVTHPVWEIWSCEHFEYVCDIKDIYGADFVEPLSRQPHSTFIASGSQVSLGKATSF